MDWPEYFKLSILLFTILNIGDTENVTFLHEIFIKDPFHLDYSCRNTINKHTWMYNEQVIFVNRVSVGNIFGEELTISANFALHFNSVNLSYEGRYACFCGSNKWTENILQIKGLFSILHLQTMKVS